MLSTALLYFATTFAYNLGEMSTEQATKMQLVMRNTNHSSDPSMKPDQSVQVGSDRLSPSFEDSRNQPKNFRRRAYVLLSYGASKLLHCATFAAALACRDIADDRYDVVIMRMGDPFDAEELPEGVIQRKVLALRQKSPTGGDQGLENFGLQSFASMLRWYLSIMMYWFVGH